MKSFLLLFPLYFGSTIQETPRFVRVLFLTDSIDRSFLITVCEHFQGEGSNWGGTDFITWNGNKTKSWQSNYYGKTEHIPATFKNRTINWSDLSCLLPQQSGFQLHLLSLHLFGSAESPPYHLGMCSKAKELNGPYCNTRERIDRAFSMIHEQIGTIDIIFFQTMMWDLENNKKNRTDHEWQRYITNVEARLQQIEKWEPKGRIFLKTTPLSNRSALRFIHETYQQRVIKTISESKNISLFDWTNTTYSFDDFDNDRLHPLKHLLMKQLDYIKSIVHLPSS